jgi:hypothetical protein
MILNCFAGAVTKVNSYEVVRELERGTTADVKLCRRSISAPSDEPEQLYVSHILASHIPASARTTAAIIAQVDPVYGLYTVQCHMQQQ